MTDCKCKNVCAIVFVTWQISMYKVAMWRPSCFQARLDPVGSLGVGFIGSSRVASFDELTNSYKAREPADSKAGAKICQGYGRLS